MPHLFEPWKRPRRDGSSHADGARHEVDDLLHARNPILGVAPQGWGRHLRLHARRSVAEEPRERGVIPPWAGGVVVFGAPLAIVLLIMLVAAVATRGPIGAWEVAWSVVVFGTIAILVVGGVLLTFMALILLVTSPWRLVRGARWLWRRALRV